LNSGQMHNVLSSNPTVFHITHWKAGSQWVKAVLTAAQPDRIVPQKLYVAHVLVDPIKAGMIYPGVYLSREQFNAVAIPHASMKFVVVRDLRDTLISWYFSLRMSHSVNERVQKYRERLSSLDFAQGLVYLMETRLQDVARIQMSWINSDELILRYEDLLASQEENFGRILTHCQIELQKDKLHGIITANSFEVITGRNKGEEDITSHYRKGIAGDWKNYFDKDIKAEFRERFGNVLIQTGYEVDNNW
jgi:hypothetical protein